MKRFSHNPKRVFAIFFAFCLGLGTAYAYNFSVKCSTGQWLYYNIIDYDNRYVELTYPGTASNPWEGTMISGNITLPTTVTYNNITYTVKAIGEYAFYQCDYLTGSLTIPNSVNTIGNYAFSGCGFTGSVTIPNSVITIGNYAFYDLYKITGTLTLGNSVNSIGNYAFGSCFSPGPNHTSFTGSLTIPNSVGSIGNYAFEHSFINGSGTLIIGNSVESIGYHAFADCTGFSGSLTIPNSVTSLAHEAFMGCTGFTGTLTIGNSVASMGYSVFENCTGFTLVKYNATNCANLASSDKPFEGCGGTLTIGSNVQKVPAHLTTGANFTLVNYNATNCTDIVSGDNPFEGCSGTLSIGSNVQRIPAYIFINCTGFTSSLTIPYSVTVIGNYAFYGCSGLTGTLTIPASMASIGASAFRSCSGFTGSLTLPNSLSSIGYATFQGCTGLTGMLTIPNSVSSIGQYAFKNCSNLTSLKVDSEIPPTLASSVFDNVPKSIPVYVPCSSVGDYQAASGWSEFTNYQCNSTVTVTAFPTVGGSVTGGGTYSSGSSVTVTASPNSGYLFLNWTEDGTVVSCNPSYTFTVSEDTELEAVFMSTSYAGTIIGEATSSSVFLPSYSYYNYSLTEQIYTAAELGGSFTINSISFFNEGATKTRTYDIYMKHTTKTEFSSTTDWVSVTSSYKVYSGSVTMRAGAWTTIVLTTPFSYNGSSNLLLVVDDNSGDYTVSPHMYCRTFNVTNNQAIRIYSDGTNYNPASPSSYTGTLMAVKNQIMLNRPGSMCDITATSANTSAGTVSGSGQYCQGDICTLKATANSGYTFMDWADASGVVVSTDANYSFTVTTSRTLTAHFISGTDFCSLTFDLFDSYGDGWNGNQLVVDFENGMSTKLAAPFGTSKATYTLPVETNTEVELSWIEGGYVHECSFVVSYTDGKVIYVGTDLDANFTYEFDMDCSGQPSELVYLGDHSMANNYFLPSYSFYNYSLSEQIYTADEIGEAGLINCIAFYNAGAETRTRTYHIYLAMTNKTAFSSPTDWISTSNATLVYNGSVTMYAGRWTPILFSTAFDYDGVSNLVLIVDDNTGTYTSSPYMSCLVYPTSACQALRIYSDGTNYDPSSPSSYTGTLQNVKNQIMLNIASCEEPLDLTVTNITTSSANIDWTSDHYSFELQYRQMGPDNDFENSIGLWTTIDADGDGYCWFVDNNDFGHDGTRSSAHSESYFSGSALDPDNYLVSPQVTLGGSITFWASAYNSSWSAEHFGVAVSTTNGTNASAFTTIQEWTMTAKGDGAKTGLTRDGGDRAQGSWYQYTVDLSAYAGQTGYVAIRHFDCYDQWRLIVDDITVVQPGVNSSWTTDDHAASPYALTGLMHGTQYEVRVRSNCVGSHYSDWVYTAFTTPDCEAKSLPYTYGFENENEFGCWSMVNCHNYTGISTNAGHVSPHGFRFYYTYYPPQYLISPELTGIENGVHVEFDYKNMDSSYPETFQVGYSTSDDNINSFVWEPEVTISNEQWSRYSTTFPAGTKYVAVRCNSYDQLSLYLDDFNFTAPESTQTVALSAGWNWVSFNAEITLDDLKAALVEAVPGTDIMIKGKSANASYKASTNRWTGRLTSLDLSQSFRIQVAEACEITMQGLPVDPADHPATVVSGANWIAFPLNESMSLTNAFAGFAVNNDVIKSKGGTSQYKNGRWMGSSLTTLEPGQGYIYISSQAGNRILTFPSNAK